MCIEIFRITTKDDPDTEPELYFVEGGNKYYDCEIRKHSVDDYRGTEYFTRCKKYFSTWSIYTNELNRTGIKLTEDNIFGGYNASGYFTSDFIKSIGGVEEVYNLLYSVIENYEKEILIKLQKKYNWPIYYILYIK